MRLHISVIDIKEGSSLVRIVPFCCCLFLRHLVFPLFLFQFQEIKTGHKSTQIYCEHVSMKAGGSYQMTWNRLGQSHEVASFFSFIHSHLMWSSHAKWAFCSLKWRRLYRPLRYSTHTEQFYRWFFLFCSLLRVALFLYSYPCRRNQIILQ